MLRELLAEDFEQYVEYTYELEMDLSNITFHIYTDGIKTKEDFIKDSKRGLNRENHKIFLYEKDGSVKGWIHYYFIEESKYVCIENMAMEHGFHEAFDELLAYWREHHRGYQWNFYIPYQNTEAMHYMEENGYLSEDVEIVDVLHFSNYTYQEVSGNFVKITKDNYQLFRELHQHYDSIMYWTSDRIFDNIQSWNIYGYIEDGICLGTIYYKDEGNKLLEIFGIDGPNGVCNLDISKKLLMYCLNEGKELGYEHMYFFCERDIHEKAIEVGFQHITDSYSCNGMCE